MASEITLLKRIHTLRKQDERLNKQIADLILERLKVREDLFDATDQLAELSSYAQYVTDHAIVRYLERIEGVDVMAIRKKIRGGYEGPLSVDGQFPLETHRIRVKGGVVVTVLPATENE